MTGFRPPPVDAFDPNYDASEEGVPGGIPGGGDPRAEARVFLSNLLAQMQALREALDRNTAAHLHRTGAGTPQQRGALGALVEEFLRSRIAR